MKLGMMFFASSEDALAGDKYRLVLECARFGDRHGFSSVWVPERHFTRLGSLYPNPAVLQAALAALTQRIGLRAGSVVAPLHDPLRIAEEWSMVDNLSGGRVGVSFASGWRPEDFAFFPDRYADRRERVGASLAAVRRLWRGEAQPVLDGSGRSTEVRIYPTPVQPELPVWLTAAGNPRTFEQAGELGAHLLTHVLDQDDEGLRANIARYREARRRAGHDPAAGQVTLMMHAYVCASDEEARDGARRPFCSYIESNIGLLGGLAKSRGADVDIKRLSPADLSAFVEFLYERFATERGLIGSPETCAGVVRRMAGLGVDEIACLLDFGPPVADILAQLPALAQLRERCQEAETEGDDATPAVSTAPYFDLVGIRRRCHERIEGEELYARLAARGVDIAPELHGIRELWRRAGEALGRVELASPFPAAGSGSEVRADPALLDACSHVIAAALPDSLFASGASLFVPMGLQSCVLHQPLRGELWSHARLDRRAESSSLEVEGTVRIYGATGRLLAELCGLRLRRLDAQPASRARGWLHQRTWREQSGPSPATPNPRLPWRIVACDGGRDRALVSALAALGLAAELVQLDDLARADAATAAGCQVLFVDAWANDPSDPVAPALRAVAVLRALVARPAPARLWLLSAGAHDPLGDGPAPAPGPSVLAALGRVIALEHVEHWGGSMDLPPATGAEQAATLLAKALPGPEPQVALRGAATFVPRLVPLAEPRGERFRPRPDASYLITGGLGGLGRALAAGLVQLGARHVVLCSRRAGDLPSAPPGAVVRGVAADLSQPADTRRLLAEVAEGPPLAGVFHLAGVLDDGLLLDQDAERFQAVCAGKLRGAWNLHRATRDLPLDCFVLFSSVAAELPAPGQGAYAVANAYLDGLARRRRAGGLPALSVGWGPWAEIGHAASDYGRRAHAELAKSGVGAIPPEQGLDLLFRLLAAPEVPPAVQCFAVRWPQALRADPGLRDLPLLAELVGPAADEPAAGTTQLAQEIAAQPAAERQAFLEAWLARELSGSLRLRPDQTIGRNDRFFDLGLDSILALELKGALERALGRSFSAVLLFKHPTLASLAEQLLAVMLRADDVPPPAEPAPAAAPSPAPPPEPSPAEPAPAEPSDAELARLLEQELDASW